MKGVLVLKDLEGRLAHQVSLLVIREVATLIDHAYRKNTQPPGEARFHSDRLRHPWHHSTCFSKLCSEEMLLMFYVLFVLEMHKFY